ncbi:hypothetical protein SDC9_193805 [bioreactor metagenome]|uniref:Uncharacterized protein n=1 Tax=bioreactor metagenome TaxID=1076179 RepID=A0A645I600_9ZZZZ
MSFIQAAESSPSAILGNESLHAAILPPHAPLACNPPDGLHAAPTGLGGGERLLPARNRRASQPLRSLECKVEHTQINEVAFGGQAIAAHVLQFRLVYLANRSPDLRSH